MLFESRYEKDNIIICVLCFRDIMKHNNKNFVGGRGAFKVGKELNVLDFSITTKLRKISLRKKGRDMLINNCKGSRPTFLFYIYHAVPSLQ